MARTNFWATSKLSIPKYQKVGAPPPPAEESEPDELLDDELELLEDELEEELEEELELLEEELTVMETPVEYTKPYWF